MSPVSPTASPELAIAALRAPGVEPGLLRSSTTRRDGYVQLADVAPTILDLLGEAAPDEIEGRAFEVSAAGEVTGSSASSTGRMPPTSVTGSCPSSCPPSSSRWR